MFCKFPNESTNTTHTLADMGYPQGPTPVETDISPSEGFMNETQKQTKLRAIKMNFYCLRDKARNKEFFSARDQVNQIKLIIIQNTIQSGIIGYDDPSSSI